MKYLKIIGLAALAAMAVMAVAASSASAATKVCSTTQGSGTVEACEAKHGTVYNGSVVAVNSGIVTLNVTNAEGKVINTVTSEESKVEGTVNGKAATGNITSQTFKKLKSSICSEVTAVTTASTTNPWPTTVTTDGETSNTNGIMNVSNVTGSFTCIFLGFPVTCKYSTTSASTTIDGSDTAPKVTATNVNLTLEAGSGSSTVCGTSADWSGTYNITTPTSLFVE